MRVKALIVDGEPPLGFETASPDRRFQEFFAGGGLLGIFAAKRSRGLVAHR
jgi:hypothetical protein